MAHKRTNFTDPQKAFIFARDRATCCFSGANLWLLDGPVRPGNQMDWVDHVVPSAKGGPSEVSNGVCASHTYNAKKRHNTADKFYLFEAGVPTPGYYELFGALPEVQAERLDRLKNLLPEDWYFNRAINHINIAFNDRCAREFYDQDYARNSEYWLGAAYRKIVEFQKIATGASLENRGVVNGVDPTPRVWLSLREAEGLDRFSTIVESVFPVYRKNYLVWAEYFWDAVSDSERCQAFERIMALGDLDPEIRKCIQCHYSLSDRDFRSS